MWLANHAKRGRIDQEASAAQELMGLVKWPRVKALTEPIVQRDRAFHAAIGDMNALDAGLDEAEHDCARRPRRHPVRPRSSSRGPSPAPMHRLLSFVCVGPKRAVPINQIDAKDKASTNYVGRRPAPGTLVDRDLPSPY